MATVIAALIAAVVATFGYLVNARAKALEERRKTYASALAAVSAYRELPHRIRRRADDKPQTRAELGVAISDIQRDLDHYRYLLDLDSRRVAGAYRHLVAKVRSLGADARASAWTVPPAATDGEFHYPETYAIDDREALADCVAEMRSNLKLVPLPRRPSRVPRPAQR